MAQSSIEWTEMTWNPTTGCTKVSAGCKYCYAEQMSRRLHAMGVEKYKDGFKVRTHDNALSIPYSWKSSKIVFVNSMSDLFHPEVSFEFIQRVFSVMNDTPQHTYQVLTKRAERLFDFHSQLNWTPNIWMGVSVEDLRVIDRIDFLRHTNAKTKFLSCEPLIGPLMNMNLQNIDWVIVGGESGRKARPMNEWWIWDIKQQCEHEGVAFFFKQWGGVNKKKSGRLLGERIYDEMPRIENSGTTNRAKQSEKIV
jgi:protein gp37